MNKFEYVNTDDGALVLLSEDANFESGKDIIYMNDDHKTAKLISVAPEMLEIVEAIAHIGVDFGYGRFELKAREILEAIDA